MKWRKWIISTLAMLWLFLFCGFANALLTKKWGHEKYIYPIVRITYGYTGGSGTIIYSSESGNTTEEIIFSTYVLTNYHVIESAITIKEEWDPTLQKEVKKEKRDLIHVEEFKYRELSTPIGTLKVEADIILYNKDEDMALIKLRTIEKANYIATLYPRGKMNEIHVLDETVAVGCSLGFPPLPTYGHLTRKGFILNTYDFWMSSSQIIYGNSGGAIFLGETGDFIGIPSLVAAVGWAIPIPHMGLFIPIDRIYKWLEKEHYDFIWDNTKSEKECLQIRKREIEAKRKLSESKS